MSFPEKVKYVRNYLNISQEQLARLLNISFSTVNRWENKKSTPSPMAKELFFTFCIQQGLDFKEIDERKEDVN